MFVCEETALWNIFAQPMFCPPPCFFFFFFTFYSVLKWVFTFFTCIVLISSKKLLIRTDCLVLCVAAKFYGMYFYVVVFFFMLSFVTAHGFIVMCTLWDIHPGVWSRGSAVSGFWIPALTRIAQFVQRIIAISSDNFLFGLYIFLRNSSDPIPRPLLPILSLSAALLCKRFYPRTGLNRGITSLCRYFTRAQFNRDLIRILQSVNDFMGSGRGCFHCLKALKKKKNG